MDDIIINQNIVELRFVSDEFVSAERLDSRRFKLEYALEFSDPIDCEWDNYFPVTPCSKNCAGGTRIEIRKRKKVAKFGGKDCAGLSYDLTAPCNEQPCCKFFC